MSSKRDMIDSMIRKAVLDEIREVGFDSPRYADLLRECIQRIAIGAAYRISGDPYRMKELSDIMKWKRPPKE